MDSPIRYSQEYRRAESAEIPSEDSSEDEENTSSDFEDPLLPWDEEWSGLSGKFNLVIFLIFILNYCIKYV